MFISLQLKIVPNAMYEITFFSSIRIFTHDVDVGYPI